MSLTAVLIPLQSIEVETLHISNTAGSTTGEASQRSTQAVYDQAFPDRVIEIPKPSKKQMMLMSHVHPESLHLMASPVLFWSLFNSDYVQDGLSNTRHGDVGHHGPGARSSITPTTKESIASSGISILLGAAASLKTPKILRH